MYINYEKIATGIADDIIASQNFKDFCNQWACGIEDELRDQLQKRFIDELRSQFNFKGDDDGEMEFFMCLVGDLTHAFMKSFVTEYLGRKW